MPEARPAKVLFVSFDVVPDFTGTSARTTEILRGLTPAFDVHALTAKTPEHGHIERYEGARLLRVPVGTGDVRSQGEAFERAVRRQLQSEEYDLVHFTDPFGGYVLASLRGQLGYRMVYEARSLPSIDLKYTDPDIETDRRFLTKVRRQELYCLTNADVVIVPSAAARTHVEGLGVASERVRVVPPPVDLDAVATAERPTADPCRFLYLGSHVSWQGLPSLLFALRLAVQEVELTCRIVGPTQGAWQRQLQEMVREFSLREKVRLEMAVPHEDVPILLAESDVGLAPLQPGERNQLQGPAPMKIAEYLGAGRPVIAADLPVTRTMIEDGVTGLLYPPSDEEALAERMVRLARDADGRGRMGAMAREAAKQRFDAEGVRRTVRRIYDELLEGRVRRAAPADPEAATPASDEPTLTGGAVGPGADEVTQLATSRPGAAGTPTLPPGTSPWSDEAAPAAEPFDAEGPTTAIDVSTLPGAGDASEGAEPDTSPRVVVDPSMAEALPEPSATTDPGRPVPVAAAPAARAGENAGDGIAAGAAPGAGTGEAAGAAEAAAEGGADAGADRGAEAAAEGSADAGADGAAGAAAEVEAADADGGAAAEVEAADADAAAATEVEAADADGGAAAEVEAADADAAGIAPAAADADGEAAGAADLDGADGEGAGEAEPAVATASSGHGGTASRREDTSPGFKG